ncbi:MAG: hypothetical protein A2Y40_02110 [Candidatus Margulisbacteria bacterium GWF2_35_9]|nr:MAG: hypothetical protein A2Y40_02110 [Candidatus Margulisbacteria bacterium GWF2_35_9]
MTNNDVNWHQVWEEKAAEENPFATMGKRSYSFSDYYLYIQDIVSSFSLIEKTDVLLDIGGGVGLVSLYFAPLVQQVYLCDYSQNMVDKARETTQNFQNIEVYQENMLDMENTKKKNSICSKVIVGSVLQYLKNYDEIRTALTLLFNQTTDTAELVFTQNPDIELKESYIKSYEKLDWPAEKIEESLKIEENRFWFDFNVIKQIAMDIGFNACEKRSVNPVLFQATHMFDFVLRKGTQ